MKERKQRERRTEDRHRFSEAKNKKKKKSEGKIWNRKCYGCAIVIFITKLWRGFRIQMGKKKWNPTNRNIYSSLKTSDTYTFSFLLFLMATIARADSKHGLRNRFWDEHPTRRDGGALEHAGREADSSARDSGSPTGSNLALPARYDQQSAVGRRQRLDAAATDGEQRHRVTTTTTISTPRIDLWQHRQWWWWWWWWR